MSQIIINEQWYEVGELESTVIGRQYLNMDGQGSFVAGPNDEGVLRLPLTPIDTPVEWTLGREVLEFVPKNRQGDVINFGMSPDDYIEAELVAGDGVRGIQASVEYFPVIWLSPPPAPLPAPMTDREALLEIQERLRGMKAVVATREFLDKHLAETITTADAGNSG